jgi:hypothetical protein
MIWIFGLITGLAFDLPTWYWVFGFFMAAISDNIR